MEVSAPNSLHQLYHPIMDKSTIRLLTLLPGNEKEDLRGTLHEVPLENAGKYEAISYAWGGPHTPCYICLDHGALSITASAHAALTCIRSSASARTVWIDSICINQADNSEKSLQVAIMAEVYSSAARTLCYIGADEEDEGARVLELIQCIGCSDFTRLPRRIVGPEGLVVLGLPPEEDPAWDAFNRFFASPWFSRLRVMQEFVLGPVDTLILYGRATVPWEELIRGVVQVDGNNFVPFSKRGHRTSSELLQPLSVTDEFNGLCAFRDMLIRKLDHTDTDIDARILLFLNVDQEQMETRCSIIYGLLTQDSSAVDRLVELTNEGDVRSRILLKAIEGIKRYYPQLQQLLRNSFSRFVTDPRDRFYACLNLSADRDHPALQPDYTESVEATYIRFARHLLLHSWNTSSLPLIKVNIPGCAAGSSFPSWICERGSVPAGRRLLSQTRSMYNAAGSTKRRFQSTDILHELSVTATLIDNVFKIMPQPRHLSGSGKNFHQFFNQLDGMMVSPQTIRAYANARQALLDITSQTLVAYSIAKSDDSTEQLREGFCQFRQVLDRPFSGNALPIGVLEARSKHALPWIRSWSNYRHDYSVCQTVRGLIGLVPNEVEVGQEIWIISGEKMPFVLRRNRNDQTKHEIVGVCCMHGLMNGEATESDRWHEEDICLV